MKYPTRHQSHKQNAYSFGFGLYIYKRVGRKKVLVYSNPEDPPARAWLDFLYSHTCAAELSGFTVPDITGTSRSVNYNMAPSCLAAAGEINKGVVLGIDSAPPALTQNALGSIVAHGTGSGQLFYKSQDLTYPIYAVSGPQKNMRFLQNIRAVENLYTSPLRIFEVGLYVLAAGNTYMFARDVIPGGILFEVGEEYFFNYRMEIPLP